MEETKQDWQLQHYAKIGESYGTKHFTKSDGLYTSWILDQIASVQPSAKSVAEVGAGTCVFASLIGERLESKQKVICYEPVSELLEGAKDFSNVATKNGGAIEFGRQEKDGKFDLIYTKDTAHHFQADALEEIHRGFCAKLSSAGRYLMVVRTPPENPVVPVGEVASARWSSVYTPIKALRKSLNAISEWSEVSFTRWEKAICTDVNEWIEGVWNRDTWSIFSALNDDEISETVKELSVRFQDRPTFDFVHQYDVVIMQKH